MHYARFKQFVAILALGVAAYIAPLTFAAPSFATHSSLEENDTAKITATSFAGAYLAGRVANNNNRINLSIDFYKQALAYDPENIATHYDMLIALLSIGEFKQAVKEATILKNKMAGERYVVLTLASDALIQKKYLLAINRLDLENPSELDSLIYTILKSWANNGRGKYNEAIQNIKKLRGPEWYTLFLTYHLALLNDVSGNKYEAEKYYQQALKNQAAGYSAPDTYERIIINYAAFEIKNNRRENAIKILQNGEKILTGRTALQNIRQNVENGGNIASAIKTAQDGASELFYDIGTAINQEGSAAYARVFLQLAKALRENNDATLYQLADINSNLQQYDEAIKLYSEIPPTSPYWRDSNLRLSLSLADNGKKTEAIAKLINLQQKFPTSRDIALSLAGIYMQDQNYDKALAVLNKIISLSEQKKVSNADWILYYMRAQAYERAKQWDKAELDFRKTLQLVPNHPQVLNYFGYSLIDRNEKLEEALKMIKAAAKLSPNDGYIIDSLGWAYYKLRRYDEAVATLENAIKLNPGDMTINEHLGDVYWQIGRTLEAGFQWNHALFAAKEPEDKLRIEEKIKNGLLPAPMTKKVENSQ